MPIIDPMIEGQRDQVLHDLRLLTSPAPPELHELCRRGQEQFGVSMALVTVIDRHRQVVKARVGTDLAETPRSDAFCDHLIGADDVLVVPDARQDARFVANPFVTGEPFVRFYAGAPLIFVRGVRLGGMCLLDTVPRELAPDEVAALVDMADEAVVSILLHEMERPTSAPAPRR